MAKAKSLIARIIDSQIVDAQTSLVTRVHPEAAEKLKSRFPHSHHHALGRTFRTHLAGQAPCPAPIDPDKHPFHVAVITAGSTDAAVAAEAIEKGAKVLSPRGESASPGLNV